MKHHLAPTTLMALSILAVAQAHAAAPDAEQRGLNELRNTVINLLQGLVEKGVLTRDQAQAMVESAQKKAATDADALAKAEEGAVRVPYIPQVVRDEISKQVAAEVAPQVTKNVIDTAQSEGWGVPAAMPDWVRRMRWNGDVRVRAQGDFFANDNVANSYINFQTVNEKGGIGKAGSSAFSNTTEDRQRARYRLRVGFDTNLGGGFSLTGRLATGALKDPISPNQTLGTTSTHSVIGVDLAYIEWAGNSATGRHSLQVDAGRIRNPYLSSDLVWDPDLAFEGIASTYRLGLMRDDPYAHFAYATVGAFNLQENEINRDKWLFGGQMGMDWKFSGGSRLRVGGALYEYRNISGIRNAFESDLNDYTAPQWLTRGNTLFDIRNDNDINTNLFALAADYRLVNLTSNFDWRVAPGYRVTAAADVVKNIGYDVAKMKARAGFSVDPRTLGYQGEIGFGTSSQTAGAWRVYVGYRYLQRDAVLDGFTDSDFRLGGTDVQGYFIGADYSINPRVQARLRYLSGNEIDGPPLAIDTVQLDLNASF